jgi:hypothetical protein
MGLLRFDPPLTFGDILTVLALAYVPLALFAGQAVYILSALAGSSHPFSDALYFVTVGGFGLNIW